MSAVDPVTATERPRRWTLPKALGPRAQVAAGVVTGFVALAGADATGLLGTRPGWWLLPVAVAAALGGAAEFAALVARHGTRLREATVQFAVAALPVVTAVGATVATTTTPCASSLTGLGWAALACAVAVASLLTAEVLHYGDGDRPVERAAAGALVVTLVGLPLAFMVALRVVGGDAGVEGRGAWPVIVPLVSLIAVVKGSDIAAYLVGSLIGRHRMAPRLSPGKTWEGAVASLLAAVGLAWLVIERGGGSARPVGGFVVFGLAVGALGMLGDLCESLIKREYDAKDSGTALGRMGGVLDLVDSLTLAAPGAWALWTFGCPG